MFDDKNIGNSFEYSLILSKSSSVNPVVAITIGIFLACAYFKILNVAIGIEKSIIISGSSYNLDVSVYTGKLLSPVSNLSTPHIV